jgi:hypothetical protein
VQREILETDGLERVERNELPFAKVPTVVLYRPGDCTTQQAVRWRSTFEAGYEVAAVFPSYEDAQVALGMVSGVMRVSEALGLLRAISGEVHENRAHLI